MAMDVWKELASYGIPREEIAPTVEKAFVPSPNLPKSQFREHLLRACRKISGKPLGGDDAIEICLVADEIWDRWPQL